MRLLLVRHGATAETGKRLSGRLPGVGLSESGRATVERLAGRLADLTLDAVYTSPVERCAETAEIIARPHHVRPREIEDLTEADYGRWTGRTLTSLYRLKAWPRLMAGASRFRFPDGETLREVQARAVGTIEHLATRHGGGALAAVSHADVIRVILAHYLGAPLDLVHRLNIDPGSVSVVELSTSGAVTVPVVNATPDMVRLP